MIHARAIVCGAVVVLAASGLGGCAGSSSVPPRNDTVAAYPWTAKAPMQLARTNSGAAVVNNRVYMTGGAGTVPAGGGRYANTIEAYDPPADTWTAKAPVSELVFGSGVAAIGNVVYMVGGADYCCDETGAVEAYDTASNTWTHKTWMSTHRGWLGVAVNQNIIYAVGGTQLDILTYNFPTNILSNVVEAYDPATNAWTMKAPMPTARTQVAVGVVNNILYAVGGHGTSSVLDTVEAYDPSTNTWTAKAPMPTARAGMAAGVLNDKLYVVGGYQDGSVAARLDTVEAFDPATNTWATKPAMPTRRQGLAVAVVDNVLYAIGGENSGVPLATVEAYKP
jgi:hypothetical protein